MITFWLLITGMTLIALGCLIFPLWRSHLGSPSKTTVTMTCLFLLILLPALSITLYLKFGASHAVADYHKTQQQAALVNAEIQKLGSVQEVIQQLKTTLAAHPDGHGWFLLGRLYMKTAQYPAAVDAFAQAKELSPDHVEILVGYAEALYFNHQSALTPAARAALERALELQPQQPDALNLLAMDAFQQRNYTQAINYWERLLPLLQQGSHEANILLEMIAAAQKQLQAKH